MRNLRRFYAVAIAIAMLVGMLVPVTVFAATSTAEQDAKMLYDLGLYKGLSDIEYQPDLQSTLNRQTGATMVLRLFGREADALEMDEAEARQILSEKFTDADEIATWAVRQVAYAVQYGVISGFPDKTFQPKGLLSGRQYCTLVLKLLEYQDFTFEQAGQKFAEVAGLTPDEQTTFDANGAIKKEVLVSISTKALDAKADGASTTLLEELVTIGSLNAEVVLEVTGKDFTENKDVEETPVTTPVTTPVATPEATPTAAVNGAVYGSVEVVDDLIAGNLIAGSTLNRVFRFKLTAPADQDLVVSSLMATEFGTASGSTTDIQRVYLMDDETVLVAGSLNNSEARLNKTLTIEKGTSKTYEIAVDVSTAATATRTIIVGFASSAAITSTPTLTPVTTAIQGGSYSIISASVGSIASTTAGTNAGGTVKVGEVSRDLGDVSITAGAEEDVKLTNLTLTVSGLTLANLDNLYLYDDTLTKIDVKGMVDGTRVIFNLGDKGQLIAKSNTKKFYLKGDITAGSSSSVSGNFKIQNNYDIIAKGMNSGVNVTVPTSAAPVNMSTADITVAAGTVSLTDTSNIPTKIVMTSANKGMIREWLVTAPSEQMNIDRIDITVTPSAAKDIDTEIQSFYLTDDKGTVLSGPVTCPSTVTDGTATVTFSDVNYYINANGTAKLQLQAVAINDSIVASFGLDAQIAASGMDYTLQTTNTVVTTFPTTASPSTFVTKDVVAGGTVTITKDETFVAVSRPVGSKATTVGKWLFAATDDNVRITKIRVTTAATLVSQVSNMKLFVDGTQVGTTCSTPTDAASDYFEIDLNSAPLILSTGVTKQLEFKADIDAATSTGFDFTIAASDLTAFSVSTNVAPTKTGTILANHVAVTDTGTLAKAAPVSDQVADAKIVVDEETELVRVKFSATNEAIKLNKIELTGIVTNSATVKAVSNIKVYELNGTTPLATLSSFTVGAQTLATTTAIPMADLEIAAAGSKVLVVKGELNGDTFTTGEIAKFGISATGSVSDATQGKGVLSQKDCFVTAGAATWGGSLTAVYAKAEVAVTTDSPSGSVTSSSSMPLLKFTVKAVGGDIYITPSAIQVTTGGTAGITMADSYLKLYKVKADGTETLVADLDGSASAMMINDTDGSDGLLTFSDYAIADGTTVTFILRAANSSAITGVATDATLSVTLDNLIICDDPSTGTTSVIYNADGTTNPKISGNALKF
jgi:hypothetical protein